ncbi:MAG TPA: hypothetical protein VH299_04610 [Solirubrobacterales bacterium]|jgi:hypothetical protein|nr:hypothetical protein [Solirubrobacterales bacterium]
MADDAITVKPKGLTDYQGELDDIADAIRQAAPDAVVEVEDPQKMERGKYGVVWGEILSVGIPAGYVFGKIADAIVGAVVAGWKRKHAEGSGNRPRFVNIYGPNDEVLRKVRVDKSTMLDADGNVRDIPQDPDETDNTDPDDAGQDDQQP